MFGPSAPRSIWGKRMQQERYKEPMGWSKERCQLAVAELMRRFPEVRIVPTIQWTTRTRRGWWFKSQNLIVIGPNTYSGPENALLHEFSHCLADTRHPKLHIVHGPAFFTALVDVTAAWYGASSHYNWLREYRRLQQWAAKDPARITSQYTGGVHARAVVDGITRHVVTRYV